MLTNEEKQDYIYTNTENEQQNFDDKRITTTPELFIDDRYPERRMNPRLTLTQK